MRRNATFKITLLIIAAFLTAPAGAGSKGRLVDAVMKIEREEGALSMELYDPLQELGLTLLDNGEHELALDTFRRMQHLVHRHRGVYAPDQIESLELIIKTYRAMQDHRHLEIQHRFIYRVAEANFEANDPRMHEARSRLARWYRNTARFEKASTCMTHRCHSSPTRISRTRIALLRAEALTLYLAGRCCASENLSAVATLVGKSNRYDFEERKRAMLDYADMLMMERSFEAAPETYAKASAMPGRAFDTAMLGLRHPRAVRDAIIQGTMSFSTAREIIELPREESNLFATANPLPASIGNPVPVCSTTVRELLRSGNPAQLEKYFIDVNVEIDERGRPREIETDGNAPVGLNRYVRSVLAETRYRPRTTEKGRTTATRISFRQTFSPERPVPMTDDIRGWSALMTSQTCQLVERAGLDAMQVSFAAD
ncbi:MAG: hypothetical protein U5O39_05015 [Gammaproteobacteria bacterium]|nr:hypothetical protein [Gammaproteobacteria bacterium]